MVDMANLNIKITSTGTKEAVDGLKSIQKEGAKAEEQTKKLGKSTKDTDNIFSGSISTLKSYSAALSALGLGLAAKEFVKMADSMTLLEARIKLVKYATDDLKMIQGDLLKTSNENRVAIDSTTKLYTKVMIPMKEMGVTTQTTLDIVNAFSKALFVGGASTEEAASATLQFAQAMASGRLQGDEFRSIAEASPIILEILAKSLGKTTGELRKLAEEGKLTSGVLGKALLGALDDLTQKTTSIPKTVSGSFQVMKNELSIMVDEINKSTGITDSMSKAIEGLTKTLKENKDEIAGTIKGISDLAGFMIKHADNIAIATTAYLAYTRVLPLATAAQVAFNTAVKANPYVIAGTALAGTIFAISESFESVAASNKKVADETQKSLNTFDQLRQNKIGEQYQDLTNKIGMQENALKGLSGTAKVALQKQIDGLKAQRDGLVSVNKEIDVNKRRQEDIAKMKGKPTDEDLKQAADRYNSTLKARIEGLKEFNNIRQKSYELELEGLGLSKADLEYQKEVLRINFDIADKLSEIDVLQKKKYAPKDTTKDADKIKLSNLNAEIGLLQSQAFAAEGKRQKARLDQMDSYYKAVGDYASQWAIKEANLRMELSGLEKNQLEAVIKFEKDAFDESVALDEKRLKNAKTTADGVSFYLKKASYDVQNDAQKAFTMMEGLSGSLETAFSSAFDGIANGSLDMQKIVLQVLNDILKEIYRVYIVKQLVLGATSAIGGLFSSSGSSSGSPVTETGAEFMNGAYPNAKGGAYNSPSLSQYSNQIVSQPTYFAFAKGGALGVAGEAGAEAIMPLGRTQSGDLGVKVANTSTPQNVKVEIINESGQTMKVSNATTTMDTDRMVIGIVLKGLDNNTMGIRDRLGR